MTGAIPTLTGSALFRINGADRVKIDGSFSGSGRYLRFMNRLNATATITLLGDATKDTIANCFIEGTNNTVGMLNFGAPALVGGLGNDSNVVINCAFRDTLGAATTLPITGLNKPNTGISSQSGNAIITNDFITVQDCEFYNFRYNAINITTTGGNYWRIYNNSVYNINDSSFVAAVWLQVDGGGGHIVRKNSFGGSAPDRSGAAAKFLANSTIRLVYFTSTSVIPTTFDSNTIGNIFTQGVFQPHFATSTTAININNNIVGGAFNPWDTIVSPNTVSGFYISGSAEVNNNIIGNLKSTGSYMANGIQTGIGTNLVMNFRNNTIRDIESLSQTVGYAAQGANGFYVAPGSSDICLIEKNTVYNINAVSAKGILLTSSSVDRTSVNANRVYNIISNSTTVAGAYAAGIVAFSSGTAKITNNQVSVGTGCNRRVFGFLSTATANTHNVFGNSFFINGAGDSASYGIYLQPTSGSSTINARNNIIYNKRTTTTGTANHFAVGTNSFGVLTAASLNYNLMIVPDTAFLANLNFSARGWRVCDTLFTSAKTYNTNWAERNALIPADSLFIDTAVANLGIVTANSHAWYASNKGLRIATLTNDYNNVTRSSSITGGAIDIGSVEFTPSSLPPIAFADKFPAANDSTQFFFGSRMLAKAVWGSTGNLPSNVDLRYYSGVNPSNTIANSTFMNAYWDMQATGGTNYDYNLTLMQDSAVHGTIGALANLQVAKYAGTATNWIKISATTVDTINGFMNANSSNTMGIFTGTNGVTNSLPVKLIAFTAAANDNNVLVSWTTASEENNKGFEVESSVDGNNFKFIGFVKGAVNSNTLSNYQLLDADAFENNASNVIYYRLKQLDLDGKFTYSKVVSVNKDSKEENVFEVFPNPFNNEFNIVVNATEAGNATVKTFDLQGKVIASKNFTTVNGLNTLNMADLANLNTGIYLVKVTVNGQTFVQKLVKN